VKVALEGRLERDWVDKVWGLLGFVALCVFGYISTVVVEVLVSRIAGGQGVCVVGTIG
jgi:hypothetical protein